MIQVVSFFIYFDIIMDFCCLEWEERTCYLRNVCIINGKFVYYHRKRDVYYEFVKENPNDKITKIVNQDDYLDQNVHLTRKVR